MLVDTLSFTVKLSIYKEHEVEAKDTLDVYISHRMTRCTEVKPMMKWPLISVTNVEQRLINL